MSLQIRPTVNVYNSQKQIQSDCVMPDVFKVPIRLDVIVKIYRLVSLSKRQPRGTKPDAGNETSARSWGTGRALARIPRVKGAGTMRAGQGACGNMCRGGRMFGAIKPYRKWQRKSNLNERRHAIASAIAASGISALVMARGHRIDNVPEIPFVLNNDIDTSDGKSKAYEVLKNIGCFDDVKKVQDLVATRTGKSRWRNRRYRRRKGPLIIHDNETHIKGFKNISGIDLCNVHNIGILHLAPGSHCGRFIIWTKNAFDQLNSIYGTYDNPSELKNGFLLPRAEASTYDVDAVIYSDEVQSKVVARPVPYNILFRNRMRKKRILDDEKLINYVNPVENQIREKRQKWLNTQNQRDLEIRKAFQKNLELTQSTQN